MRLTRARDIVSAFVNPSSYDAKCDCEHHAPLVPFVASMRGYVCDVCECTKPKGQVFLAAACDVCDYHVCVSCALAKWHRQAVFAEIHFGREAIPTRAPHPTRSRTRCPCKKPFDAIATPTDGFECNKCGGVQLWPGGYDATASAQKAETDPERPAKRGSGSHPSPRALTSPPPAARRPPPHGRARCASRQTAAWPRPGWAARR